MQEVSKLRADDELNYIIFLDDTFTINHAWVQSFCRLQRGYLPENYYDHPANHRASILTLPDLRSEDIEYYYNKFTQLRVRDRLQKLPKGADSTSRQTVIDQVEECAVHG